MVVPYNQYFVVSDRLAVPLARYAKLMGCPEQAFFGCDWAGSVNYHCPTIWTQDQRTAIHLAILEAQQDIEEKIGYDLIPKYHEGERHPYLDSDDAIRTHFPEIIACGTLTINSIGSGAVMDYTNDPAAVLTIDISGLGITDPHEIHVYHPNTDIEITPSKIIMTGGNDLDIEIPKCRCVVDDNNPATGWDYTDNSLFETTVDVRWEYLDTTAGANIVKQVYANPGYTESSITGYVRIANAAFGLVMVRPNTFIQDYYSFIDLNYSAGLESIDELTERIIIAYAHTKMPVEPVDNDYLKTRWLHDRETPSNVSQAMQDCPWGLSEGAWRAWKLGIEMHMHRAGSI